MELSDDQFQAVVADTEGQLDRVFSRKTHINGLISVENIRAGDLFRHMHQHEYPYQRATGSAMPDREYPKEGHLVIPTQQSTTPHLAEGTKLKVIRERKQR